MRQLAIRKTWDNKYEVIKISEGKCFHGETRKFSAKCGSTNYKTERGARSSAIRWLNNKYTKHLFHGLLDRILEQSEYTGEIKL